MKHTAGSDQWSSAAATGNAMQEEHASLGTFCCPSPPRSLKNYSRWITSVKGCSLPGPHAEVANFSVSSCKTAGPMTILADSLYLLWHSSREGDTGTDNIKKQMGTPMFHKASQSFYTQSLTSIHSCPIPNSLPNTVWPTVDTFGCQSVPSQCIQRKSRTSLLSCNC